MSAAWITYFHDGAELLVLIVALISYGYMFYLRGIFASKASVRAKSEAIEAALGDGLEKINTALTALDRRVGECERHFEGKVPWSEMHGVKLQVTALDGVVKRIDSAMGDLKSSVDRIEGYLIDQGRRVR